MNERVFLLAEALIYAFTLLAGGVGGAAMASRRVLTHRPTTCAMVIAYSVVGSAAGGVTFAALAVLGMSDKFNTVEVLSFCTFTGAALAAGLGGLQGGLSVILEKLGWHVELKIDRRKPGSDLGKTRQDSYEDEQ